MIQKVRIALQLDLETHTVYKSKPIYSLIKRFLDIVISLVFITALSPLFLVIRSVGQVYFKRKYINELLNILGFIFFETLFNK